MTSKNSFLVSMKENNKRRIWLWVLSLLGFVVAMPTATAMILSRSLQETEYYVEIYGEQLGQQMIQKMLIEDAQQVLGPDNTFLMLLLTAIAVISAIQGFSFLYSRKKTDFYLSVPVKRRKRFLLVWLNGILVYLIPYLLGTAVSILIAVSEGAVNSTVTGEILQALVLYFGFYMGIYHIAILAVMMTGQVLITCMGVGLFLGYEYALRLMVQGYMSDYFKFFSRQGYESAPTFSPFTILYCYLDQKDAGAGNLAVTMIYFLLFAAAVGILAYICYLKRPAEAAGKAMAFEWPKAWIKILTAVPATLMAGLILGDTVGYRPNYGGEGAGLVLFTMALVLVVVCCLIQVLYEFDIKGILHKKRHILISAVLTVLVLCVFKFDLVGYDSYIPKAEKVESVVFSPEMEDYSSYYGYSYFDENMKVCSRIDYMSEYMYLHDVGTVNKLLKKSIETVGSIENMRDLYNDEDISWYTVLLLYRMADGRNIYREIYVDVNDPETVELIDRIESSEEFISAAYPGTSDHLMNALESGVYKIGAKYGNRIYQNTLSTQEALELLKLYQEDMKNTGFISLRENVPTGSLVFSLERRYDSYSSVYETELKIYPFFEKCLAFLREHGYYREQFFDPEEVDRIQVVNYNYDIMQADQKQEEEAMSMQAGAEEIATAADSAIYDSTEYERHAVYEGDQLKQFAGILYPDQWITRSWHMDMDWDSNYFVTVYFKSDSEAARDNGGVAYFYFMEGEVPDFVAEDTAY